MVSSNQVLSCLLVGLIGLGTSSAADIGGSSTCDADCQKRANMGASWEADQHASTDFAFYTIPSNFSTHLSPGSILEVEDATNLTDYTVPSGLSMSRIIYTTVDLHGKIVPASAYILWPYAPLESSMASQGQFPLVAWGHGTAGVFKSCAPSNYRNLQYHFMSPFLLALQGMAVVAPDYAGLGFDTMPSGKPINHPWLTGPAQANDLANAITAARTAFPSQLSPTGPFVAMGHSQGGQAAWSFAERLVHQPMEGYMGTVAIAPPTRTIELLERALANMSEPFAPVILSAQPKLVSAVTALFPSYNYSGLTPLSSDRWFNVFKPLDGCLPTDSLVFQDVPLGKLARQGWTKDEEVQQFAKLAETGRKEFRGPLLILAGESDIIVPVDAIQSAVEDTCSMLDEENWDESLEMISYAEMNHFPVIQASQMKWLEWVKERLAGKPVAKSGCTHSVVDGFRTEFTPQTAAPNFLEVWAKPEKSWKYAL